MTEHPIFKLELIDKPWDGVILGGTPVCNIPERYLNCSSDEDGAVYEAFKQAYKNVYDIDYVNPLEKEKQNDC